MFKLLISMLLLLSTAMYAQNISPEEAKKLSNSLPDSKRDTLQIRSLLQLAKYHVFKRGENKNDLDSAADLISKAEESNAIIKSKWADGYISLIQSYWMRESGQKEKAKETIRRAVDILKNETDKNLTGEACMDLGSYLDYNDEAALAERIELTKLAVTSYNESGNIQQKAASLQMLGDLYNIRGDNYLALEKLQAALDAYNSINYQQVQGIYTLMGFTYTRLREYRKGLEKHLLALRTAEATGDSSMQLCQVYSNLGEIYMALKEQGNAIGYYEKALRVAERHNEVKSIYLVGMKIVIAWVALKKPVNALQQIKDFSSKYKKPDDATLDYNMARCYIGIYGLTKEFDKAMPYVKQVHKMIENATINPASNLSAYTILVRFYIEAGEDAEASKYLEIHGQLAKKNNDLYYLAANEKLHFMLDTLTNDYKSAIQRLLRTNQLNDSLALETRSKDLDKLEVQFETEKKEGQIIAKNKDIQLLTKQSELQKSRIERSKLLRNFMIAVAGLLLLILALVFRGYTIKKRNNHVLSKQRVQIDEQNHSLQAMVRQQERLIDEKEWLLKEIHHRVKNNLQIVMSLLNSQSAYIDNESALTAIHDSQHRVHAMSLIHQKLYSTENVSSIDMSFYIRELASYLADSFDTTRRIRFEFSIEPLEMDVSQAVPLGLILNEAITNSIKYAFPDDRNGIISISLSNTGLHNYLLTIADNGIGTPVHFKSKKPGSLGMSLMKGLSEDIDGSFSIENNNGTVIKISFVYEPEIRRSTVVVPSFVSTN